MSANRLAARVAVAPLAVALVAVPGLAQAQVGMNSRALGDAQAKEREKLEQQRAALNRRDKPFPTKAHWVAVSLNGKPFGGERPSLTLDEQFRVRGFGGCNAFAAVAYPMREQRFAVGPIQPTKKSCDKGVMSSELNFLQALRTSVQWDMDNAKSSLVIKTQAGELKFERTL